MTTTDISLLERTATVRGQLDETGRVLDLVSARLGDIKAEQDQFESAVLEQEVELRDERISAINEEVRLAEEAALATMMQLEEDAEATTLVDTPSEDLEAASADDVVEDLSEENVVEMAPTDDEPVEEVSQDVWDEAPPLDEPAPMRRLADVVSLRPLEELDDAELSDEEKDFEQRFNDFAGGDTDDASRRWLTG